MSRPQESRTGKYVRQTGGYEAFVPTPLPPAPAVVIDAEMQDLLSKADRSLGRLDGSIQTLPNPDLFIFMYVRKEAVLSSQIEGTQASINDVLEAEAKIFRVGRPNDVREVLNYVNAMNYGLARLKELPLSVRLIREIHERLLTNARGSQSQPGEIRKVQNWIGLDGESIQNATYVPPPPQLILNALGDLEKFLHDDAHIPTLIKIGLAHAQFETIHPVLDGNGRVGRLLITFLLCERKILQTPVLYISRFFKKHRDDYYRYLQLTRDAGDWESWLKFFLIGVTEVSNEATETARKIVNLRETHRRLISERFGRVAGNGIILLENFYKRPILQVNDVVNILSISYPSANQLLGRFVKHEIVNEVTGRLRNRRFRYSPYIDLFSGI
jgi:Fic family protein